MEMVGTKTLITVVSIEILPNNSASKLKFFFPITVLHLFAHLMFS